MGIPTAINAPWRRQHREALTLQLHSRQAMFRPNNFRHSVR
jgi:hypothetical protein